MNGSHNQLTRLPGLAGEVMRHNIERELAKLEQAASWHRESGRSAETLVKHDEFRIVLLRMKQGSYMSHHRAEGPISIYVIHGTLRVHLPDDRTEELKPGDLLTLERGLEHDVEAVEASSFMLTIAWPEAAADHSK